MNSDSNPNDVEQICKIIDLLRPCMNDYLYVYDFTKDFFYISPHATSRFALKSNSFHDVVWNLQKVVYPNDFLTLLMDLDALSRGEKTFHTLDYRWIDKEGHPVWINCRGHVVMYNGQPVYMVGCLNEIGKQQQADNISGLLSKSSLQSFLEVQSSIRQGYVLRLGLDDFKKINEKHGVEYGDMILKKTAECISSCITPTQKLYRIVADEFIILDPVDNSKKNAKELYKQIRRNINRFVEDNHYDSVFSISGGILYLDKNSDCSFSNIMKLSEFALNEAKRQGKNRYYTFAQEDYSQFIRKQNLSRILRQAVYHDFEGFETHFQPLFPSDDSNLYGAEALMRFYSEEYGKISPSEFIPILEETGLIVPAGRWIMHQALNACRRIQEKIPDFRININISSIQIMNSDIISEVENAVKEYGISPSSVVLEITESQLLESDTRFAKLWERLKKQGIHLALDDFGTGYSNFHYINDLKPDIIKIDRNFTSKALTNEFEYSLLSSMIEMVHNLNLKLCIEGIETEEEQHRILTLKPDYEQGFYLGKPCPLQHFLDSYVSNAGKPAIISPSPQS